MTSRKLFRSFYESLGKDLNIDVADIEARWWHNRKDQAGLRVTAFAYQNLLRLGVEHHVFDINGVVLTKPRLLLDLDRRMTCAYYLQLKTKPQQLILFGSKEAMLLALYGDLEKFLSNALPRAIQ
jgi:hypothetical protein